MRASCCFSITFFDTFFRLLFFDLPGGKLSHEGEAGVVGMDSIFGELGLEGGFCVGHGSVVIEEVDAGVGGIVFDPAIEGLNFFDGLNFGTPGVARRRQHRSEDDANAVFLGQLHHGYEVVLNRGERGGAGIFGDVVGASEDDDCFRLEGDDVLTKAEQDLGSGLSADAAVDVGLAGKRGGEVPHLGDGVSEEHDSGFSVGGRTELGVSFAVLRQVRPVAQPGGELLALLLE